MTDHRDDVTPTRPSDMHRLGLATCPVCAEGGGQLNHDGRCAECDGCKRVSLSRYGEIVGLKTVNVHDDPDDTIPPTDREP